MAGKIDLGTLQECDVCNDAYVQVPTSKVDIEQFIEDKACSGCGHKSLKFEVLKTDLIYLKD